MPAVNEVTAVARKDDGTVVGALWIALLPRSARTSPWPLVVAGDNDGSDEVEAPIQLLEGYEYLYEWQDLPLPLGALVTDPEEAFQPDTEDGRKGRLRPGLGTGTLQVAVRVGAIELGRLDVEVRARKLNYRSEYRWMLRDIAEQMTELVMDRFAPTAAVFAPDETRDAVTLYQRFAFLRALLTSETFQAALSQILRRPHVAWEDLQETVTAGQPLRAGANIARQIAKAGPRLPWTGGPIQSLPLKFDRRRTEATHDTTPNRFVRFALERWRQVVASIDNGLGALAPNPAVGRGRREIAKTLEQLDLLLNHELFKDLGPLARFPADDQVLQRREGYRDVFRAYLEFELAARLSWRPAASSYAAGQRDVATLYEYWVFLQLARIVAQLTGQSFDLTELLEVGSDGLNVVLQQGKEVVLSGVVVRHGRKLNVELCFNRSFRAGGSHPGSWTRPMRPDCSLFISAPQEEPAPFEPVILHFDAKYRVNNLVEIFGETDTENDGGVSGNPASVLRDDLLKMHAYRDAIRRSAGAFVLYPGDDRPANRTQYFEYHELLPGLGAFVLRPTDHGDPSGVTSLRAFLDDVLDHVAQRLTHHERGRYWLEEVYGSYEVTRHKASPGVTLRPGPDTTVLLGFVKSREHWDWIHKYKTYNVRTEGRLGGVARDAELLYCHLIALYAPDEDRVELARIVSGPQFVDKTAMANTGYPAPSEHYLCVQISCVPRDEITFPFKAAQIGRLVKSLGKRYGEPTAVRWAALANMDS
jgi:predicted component of viral defense system (DUF524 family)